MILKELSFKYGCAAEKARINMEAFMKKFTALMLVALLVVMAIPFGVSATTDTAEWFEVKTAEDFAKMTDGNYWLTADIDLSQATWTTIAEFSGTLNGNGKTVTVPTDAPIFDKVTGTIKNVNLKGTVTFDDADASAEVFEGNHNCVAIGVLANYAQGATIENVHSSVELTFAETRAAAPSVGTTVGGLVGVALADYEVEENEGTKTVKLNKNTTITNVSNTGKMTVNFASGKSHKRDNFGGIVGGALGNVDVSLALVSAELTTANCKGNMGGIVGYIYSAYEDKMTGASETFETEDIAITLTDCLYNGTFVHTGEKQERWGGIVGYAHNVIIKNCANEGSAEGPAVAAGILGYGNCNSAVGVHCIIIENTVSIGEKGCDTWTSIKAAGKPTDEKYGHLDFNNIPLLKGNKLNATSATGQVNTNVVEKDTKADVRTAFIANGATNFEVKSDVLTLKMPAFTPEEAPALKPMPSDPPVTPNTTTATQNTTKAPQTTKAPTTDPVDEEKGGCKSFAVGSVALLSIISLAGVSVLAKKKETK